MGLSFEPHIFTPSFWCFWGSCRNRIPTTEPQLLPTVMMAKERPGCQMPCEHCDDCTSAQVSGTKNLRVPFPLPCHSSEGNEEVCYNPNLNTMYQPHQLLNLMLLWAFYSHWDRGNCVALLDGLWVPRKLIFSVQGLVSGHVLSSSSSSVRLRVSWEACWEGSLSCSQTVPVPVLERDMVARLRR